MRSARAALLSLIVAPCALFASACSDTEGGTAQADDNPETPAPSPQSTAPANTGSNQLSTLDPCSVLSTDEVKEYGTVTQGAPKPETDRDGTRLCTWKGDAHGPETFVPSTSVTIREDGGVQDMNDKGNGVQHTQENGREYGRSAGPGGCTIAIGVTKKSRVDILVTGTEKPNQACAIANSLTETAESRVPHN